MANNSLIEKKMKGSATQYKGGVFEFTPYGEGTAVYTIQTKEANRRSRRLQAGKRQFM